MKRDIRAMLGALGHIGQLHGLRRDWSISGSGTMKLRFPSA
jgi:hypothetical protein